MQRQHAHAPHLELSPVRIAGTSAAIALHAAILMLLFVPTTWAPPTVVAEPEQPAMTVEIPPIVQPVAPPLPTPVIRRERPVNTAAVTKPATTTDVAVISDTGPQVAIADTTPHDDGRVTPPQLAVAELTADIAPAPPYPALALREGKTGMVMLRIAVDVQGHPVAGSIEKSSGSRLLDQAALKFVLAHWHFNPAVRDGMPIGTFALVPIEFSLDQ